MGMWELALVLVVGLIVLGPERLPTAIRSVSRFIKTAKQFGQNVQSEISEELRIHELHKNLKDAEAKGMKDLPTELQSSVDELKKAAESVTGSYKDLTTSEQKKDDK